MKMKPCPLQKQNIEDMVCGRLSTEQKNILLEHLSGCSECRQYHQMLVLQEQRLSGWVASLEPQIQTGRKRLLGELKNPDVSSGSSFTGFRNLYRDRLLRYTVAAGIVFVAGFFAARCVQPVMNKDRLFIEWSQTIQPQIERHLAVAVAEQLRPELVEMKKILSQQISTEIQESAATTLALSQTANAHFLDQLVQAIETVQARDRRNVTNAFEYIEQSRLRDRMQLEKSLASLAVATDEEISKTRQQFTDMIFVPAKKEN